MNINIKATNTTLSDSMRNNVYDKLSAIEEFLRDEDKIQVELEEITRHKSGETARVEIHIRPHGFYAEAFGNDIYEALDLAIPKIREQLTRGKDKKVSLRRRLGSIFKRNRNY